MALPGGIEGGYTLTCIVGGCGQTAFAERLEVLPGWTETADGVVCPRHVVVMRPEVADMSPEVAALEATLEDSRRSSVAELEKRAAANEAEALERAAALTAKRAERTAQLESQRERERGRAIEAVGAALAEASLEDRGRAVRKRLELTRPDQSISVKMIEVEVDRTWPNLLADDRAAIVKAASK